MSAATLRLFRKTHLYFGLFISPALLFFASTGAVQTLSLHEAAGRSYKPPAILAELGQIHKKQTMIMPAPKPEKPRAAYDAGSAQTSSAQNGEGDVHAAQANAPQKSATLAGKQKQHLPVKIFFLIVALGLFTSTTTGIYMAYRYERNKLVVTGTVIAGVVIPFLLLKL